MGIVFFITSTSNQQHPEAQFTACVKFIWEDKFQRWDFLDIKYKPLLNLPRGPPPPTKSSGRNQKLEVNSL